MNVESLLARTRADGECLRWTGAHISTGYGHVGVNGKARRVHRVMYELVVGPIPAGMDIDHTCFVRDCINPSHLEAVSHRENLLRSARAGRGILAQIDPDYCPQGHPRSPENTKVIKGVVQGCRACHRERSMEWGKRIKRCPHCGSDIQAKSLARHLRTQHQIARNSAS